jgi:hypothetical protein
MALALAGLWGEQRLIRRLAILPRAALLAAWLS